MPTMLSHSSVMSRGELIIRKELIAPTLPKEIREVCSSSREVTSLSFGEDWTKALRGAKKIASCISRAVSPVTKKCWTLSLDCKLSLKSLLESPIGHQSSQKLNIKLPNNKVDEPLAKGVIKKVRAWRRWDYLIHFPHGKKMDLFDWSSI